MTLDVLPIPLLNDNYAYLVVGNRGECVVVDPSEAAPVERAVKERGLSLRAVWCTHHHPDHVGGVRALCERFPSIEVFASEYDVTRGRIEGATRGLADGESVSFGEHDVRIHALPGHTLGAIAFHLAGALFVGDTLFGAGCGRVFEGTMPMMRATLAKIAALTDDTRLYFGHEYTEKNLAFAALVEPDNAALRTRSERVATTRARGEGTTPSTIAEERATNPFLRAHVSAVAEGARRFDPQTDANNPDDVFRALREARNRY